MRSTLLVLFLSLAVGGVYFVKSRQPQTAATVSASPSPTQASQHNWPKNALDRAGDVKRQVAQQRKEDNAH